MIDYDRMGEAELTALNVTGYVAAQPRQRATEADKATRERRHKYGAVATEYNGRKYPSKAQARYAAILDARKAAGEIAGYLEEVWFPLGPDFGTRVDFVVAEYWNPCARLTVLNQVHEVKGRETPRFRQIRKLWPKYAWMPMHIIKLGEVEIIQGA